MITQKCYTNYTLSLQSLTLYFLLWWSSNNCKRKKFYNKLGGFKIIKLWKMLILLNEQENLQKISKFNNYVIIQENLKRRNN